MADLSKNKVRLLAVEKYLRDNPCGVTTAAICDFVAETLDIFCEAVTVRDDIEALRVFYNIEQSKSGFHNENLYLYKGAWKKVEQR